MGTVAWPPQEKDKRLEHCARRDVRQRDGQASGCFPGGVINREPRPAGRAVDLHP